MAPIRFRPFPVLTTERLTLRQVSLDDQHHVFALRSDKEINKYLNRRPCSTVKDAIDFINMVNDNIKNNTSIYWGITLTKTGTFVGTICLFDFSNQRSSCEIGYELMPAFQGQGIMKEAAEKVIGYAFQTLQFQNIRAYTHKDNLRSTQLLTKCNFVKSTEAGNENSGLNLYTLAHSHDQRNRKGS